MAPGKDIKSAWIGGSRATKTLSGTSAASPLTAGVAALVLQEAPNMAPRDVYDTLQCSASRGQLKDLPSSTTPDLLLHAPPEGFPAGKCVSPDSPGGHGGGGGSGKSDQASWGGPRPGPGRAAFAAVAVAGAVMGRGGPGRGRGAGMEAEL